MKKYIFLALSAGLLGLASCTENTMDTINKNNESPSVDAVPAKYQLTDAIMATGYSVISGDFAFYVSSLTEQEVGVGNNQLMKAELRNSSEWAASTTFSNVWNAAYSNLLNIKQIKEKIESEDGNSNGQYDILGMAQVLEALNYGVLTDMFGDIPYSEACQGTANTQPKLDSQKDIYAGVLSTLDTAISNLEKGAELSNAGSQDIAYSGDITKWEATAYALKARYYIHQSAVDQSVIAKAEEAAEKAIELGFDGFLITEFNGATCDNPWSAYIWSRYYTACSSTVTNLMTENDPRYTYYIYEGYATVVNPGDDESAKVADGSLYYPEWYDLGSQPIHMMSVSELYFILAETQLRQGKDATDAFQTAVAASISDIVTMCGGNDSSAESYAESLGTPDLKLLFEQKYIAQCNDEQVETYNDIRRCEAMGETYITLTNPYNTQSGINRFPVRLPYGNSAVISNPNVAAVYGDGYYIYTDKTWINGGN